MNKVVYATNLDDSEKVVPNKINWPLLGGIRFFLAFIVLTEHLGWFVTNDPMLKIAKFSPLVAVLGFLVISGFSIAASFEADKQGFYFRRGLRIIPIYVLCILFSEFVTLFINDNVNLNSMGEGRVDLPLLIGNLFFLQGFFIQSLESNPIVWTLSIEVFFYILTPYIKAKNKWVLFLIILSAILFVTQRYLGFIYYSQMLYGGGVIFLGWAWLVGYWYYHHREYSGAIYFLISLGVLSVTINGYFIKDFWTVTWVITCTAVGYGHHLNLPFPWVLKTMGDVSYPMYLLHFPVFKLISDFSIPQNGFYYLAIIITGSFFVDRLFDRPIKNYFRRNI